MKYDRFSFILSSDGVGSRLSSFGLCMLLKFKPKQLVTNNETAEVVDKMATSGDCVARMW